MGWQKIVVNGYPRFDQLLNLQNQKDLNVLKNKYINDLNYRNITMIQNY